MFEAEYTVRLIDGDYAILVTDNGDENRVARALLPLEIEEGMRLSCVDFIYTVL